MSFFLVTTEISLFKFAIFQKYVCLFTFGCHEGYDSEYYLKNVCHGIWMDEQVGS